MMQAFTKATKKTLGVLSLFAVVLVFSGCQQKKEDSVSVRTVGSRTEGNLKTGIELRGIIGGYANEQDGVQDAVKALLSATMPEEYVGYVSATGANQTGIFFGGRVRLANGTLQMTGSSGSSVAPDSEVMIAVYDSFPNQQNVAPIPPIYITRATGSVQGTRAVVKFEDKYGWIQFDGTINGQVFTGWVDFQNSVNHVSGKRAESGRLGRFEIPTCQFFLCQ